MERRVIIVCCFVGFLGILSAATGFAAEAKRGKASQVIVTPNGCRSPRTPAFGLGLIAAVSLLIAQIILNVCICNSPHHRNLCSCTFIVFLILSWIIFGAAFLVLLWAADSNSEHMIRYNLNLGNHCTFVDPGFGFFSGAAFMSQVSVALGIQCYHTLTKAPRGASAFPTHAVVVTSQGQVAIV